ncbi:hypothetical protein FB446DRAFT_760846, partial [Lentinula raphanica]
MAPHRSESPDPLAIHASTSSMSQSSQIHADQASSKPFRHLDLAQTLPKSLSTNIRADQSASEASNPSILHKLASNPYLIRSGQIRPDQSCSLPLKSPLTCPLTLRFPLARFLGAPWALLALLNRVELMFTSGLCLLIPLMFHLPLLLPTCHLLPPLLPGSLMTLGKLWSVRQSVNKPGL